MKEIIIKTRNLSKEYKGVKALDGVDMNLAKGDIYGLVGENGSGKSTLMKTILGLVLPGSGEVEIFGETTEEGLNRGRTNIGSIVESPRFYDELTGEENLKYYRIQRGMVDEQVIREALELIGISDLGKKKFKEYSLGMKQRLGLAYVIMQNPEIMILDEPINGLDPSGIAELRRILLRINREQNTTILISSHILDELSQVATTYGFISKGKLLKEIGREDLEKECRRYLKIKVDDLGRATTVLELELDTLDYKVKNEDEIHLYDYLDAPERIINIFSENGLAIKSINEEGIKLEDYYMDLIGGNKDA